MSKQKNLIEASQNVTFDTSGNVGIGTDDPNKLLHLKANSPAINLHSDDASSAQISFTNSGGVSEQGFIKYEHDGEYSGSMQFRAAGTERMRILSSGGQTLTASVQEARWFVDSSAFNNPTINLFTAAVSSGGTYPQACFEVEIYGNGVSANEHQVFRGNGTFNFSGASVAENLTTYTNYHKGNALPAVPSFSLSGNTLRVEPKRQTNYDVYRILVRVWGRQINVTWGSHD